MDKKHTARAPGECNRANSGRNPALLFFNEASYNKKMIVLNITQAVNGFSPLRRGPGMQFRKRRK
jgi:hypothetical protein